MVRNGFTFLFLLLMFVPICIAENIAENQAVGPSIARRKNVVYFHTRTGGSVMRKNIARYYNPSRGIIYVRPPEEARGRLAWPTKNSEDTTATKK